MRFHARPQTRNVVRLPLIAALAAFSLLLASTAAPADAVPPVLTLAPTTIANGVANVSGTVGGSPGANLSINGQQVAPNANGSFSTALDLSGKSSITFSLTDPATGQVTTTTIPLTTNVLGPNGVIPPDVLKTLQQAGITLDSPPGGFQSLDGLPVMVGGKLLDKDQLQSLKINGVEVLPQVKPDGSFAQPVNGSSKEVTVTATDKQGVSQTTTFPVGLNSSVVRTASGTSISAAGANGLRIATVKYTTKKVAKTKRITMTVTLRDKRGYLVRGAILRVRPTNLQARAVIGGQQAKVTNKLGRAAFVLKLRSASFTKAKRLFTTATGATASATAKRTTSVRVPRLAKARVLAKKR